MKCLTLLSLLLLAIPSFAQDSVMSAANPDFKINIGRKIFVGPNYREEWTTPIKVPVVRLSQVNGGLTPVKLGGGKQTKTLRMKDPSGKTYSLRTIEKFVSQKTIPIDLESKAVVDLVADGISASYPYAALSVPVLSEAAGVPYLKTRLIYVGDDPRLGEFKKDFANRLVYLEEREPEGHDKIYDTDEVAEKVLEDPDDEIDQKALLRIRILDMFMMDFDRHEDQWVWIAHDKGKGKVFTPVPKDRDQVFYTNEGLFSSFAQWPWMAPQLEGFKAKAKNIRRFNFSNRNFDRFFLHQLERNDWVHAVDSFLPLMTDEVIEKALNQQPPEIRGFDADKIKCILRERRKYLKEDVMDYYTFLAEAVNIPGTEKDELFEVTPYGEDSLRVRVYSLDDKKKETLLYDRTFDADETDEVRLYGMAGNDQFKFSGANERIKVRIIGGTGKDKFENSGPQTAGLVYDLSTESNEFKGKFIKRTSADSTVNQYERLYFQYNQLVPFISAGFNLDDGLYLGGQLKIIRHDFRKAPYRSAHSLIFNHALGSKALLFRYRSEFIGLFSRATDLVLDAELRAPAITNFFGYGDNTHYDKDQPGKFRYYRARYSLGEVTALIRRNVSKTLTISAGPTFQQFNLDPGERFNRERYIVQTQLNGLDTATLYATQTYAGFRAQVAFDTRDHQILPTRGIFWQNSLQQLYNVKGTGFQLSRLNSDLTWIVSTWKQRLTFANRIGAGHNIGNYEFYQAQYLGNDDNLRGYRKYRFAGGTKVYNNLEMRLKVSDFYTYLFPGSLGILAFYDVGRIWAENDPSDRWLSGYGAGIWFSPWRRAVITLSVGISEEDTMPIGAFGWQF